MKNNNNEYVIYFCGISKNCHKNIEKNLKFLDTFSKDFRYSTKVVVVDSDSNDGTKDIIKKYKNKNNFIINELDGLEGIYSNRIKRISNTRMNIDRDSSINLFRNVKDVVLPHPKKSANPCKAPRARAKGKSTASK